MTLNESILLKYGTMTACVESILNDICKPDKYVQYSAMAICNRMGSTEKTVNGAINALIECGMYERKMHGRKTLYRKL